MYIYRRYPRSSIYEPIDKRYPLLQLPGGENLKECRLIVVQTAFSIEYVFRLHAVNQPFFSIFSNVQMLNVNVMTVENYLIGGNMATIYIICFNK